MNYKDLLNNKDFYYTTDENGINRYYMPSVKYGIAIERLADELNLTFTQFEGEDVTAIIFGNVLIGYVLCP